jgi:hypothetical protein
MHTHRGKLVKPLFVSIGKFIIIAEGFLAGVKSEYCDRLILSVVVNCVKEDDRVLIANSFAESAGIGCVFNRKNEWYVPLHPRYLSIRSRKCSDKG